MPSLLARPTRLILAASIAALAAGTAIAIHPKNAGPQEFEIKHKLPPPPVLSPEEAVKAMKVAPGFKVELVAAEPMVQAPVAINFDEQGRMWAVEMRGYMHDVEGAGEDQPNCQISILEDTDGDGVMDKSTVFADGLVLARAVLPVAGGALVGEPPNLWFMKDTDGDGKADEKVAVATDFGLRDGQPEHMANSPSWLLDNWIYFANWSTRVKWQDGKWLSETTNSRGQWGMTQDDWGRPYYNFNSDFLRGDMVPAQLYRRNPNYTGTAGAGVQVVKDQTVWPIIATPGVNRGYEKNALREDGTLKASTATGGAVIYRGSMFPPEFAGNAFIPEPAGFLVKRFILSENDGTVTAKNAYEKQEFLASTDERFRPVNAHNGPDGALYIVDMARGVIQHKGFLTHYLVANIKERKLEQPVNLGRIWRIVPENAAANRPKPTPIPKETVELVKLLGHPNGWHRDTAQRLLVERKDPAALPTLQELAIKGEDPRARVHALWTLEGVKGLTPEVLTAALKDKNERVRATAVHLADRTLAFELVKLVDDPSIDVQIALAFELSAANFPETDEAAAVVLERGANNAMIRDGTISGLRGRELEFLERVAVRPNFKGESAGQREALAALAHAVMNERRSARIARLLTFVAGLPNGSPGQSAILAGMAGQAGGKVSPRAKLIYLESEPAELAKLSAGATGKAKNTLAALDKRLAWPGKPGVPPPPVVKPLTAEQKTLFDKGKEVYVTLCGACHQPHGAGQEGLAPPVADSDWVLGSDDRLVRVILHGLSGPISVNGTTWNLEMPPMAHLTDEQIAGVLTYIRREWENNADPVSVDRVAEIRETTKDRAKAWTQEELAKLAAAKKKAK